MGRRSKLSPDVVRHITDAIRAGAFDYVAAQSAGIDPGTFRRWMADGRPAYRAFRADVRRARAQARVDAENRVFRNRPFEWLRYGPGRDRLNEPGWTDSRSPWSADELIDEALNREIRRAIKEAERVGVDTSELREALNCAEPE